MPPKKAAAPPEPDHRCKQPDCTATIPKAHKWAKIKSAWFISKDEKEAWCPDHLPEWVAGWREKQKQGKADPKQGTILMVADCTTCGRKVDRPPGEGRPWQHSSDGTILCKVKSDG